MVGDSSEIISGGEHSGGRFRKSSGRGADFTKTNDQKCKMAYIRRWNINRGCLKNCGGGGYPDFANPLREGASRFCHFSEEIPRFC